MKGFSAVERGRLRSCGFGACLSAYHCWSSCSN